MNEIKYDTLVLSGGGIGGFSLLGGLQYAYDNNLLSNVKNYIGTSVGSIIAYLLVIGYTPTEIMVFIHLNNVLEKIHYIDLLSGANGNGALSFSPISEALDKMTIQKIGKYLTMKKLKDDFGKVFVCTTYNSTKCELEYLSHIDHPDLPCLTALRMSCNIPLIFDRFKYMGNFYVDGGILENFSILKGQEMGRRVLGLNLDIFMKAYEDNPSDGTLNYILRLLRVQSAYLLNSRLKEVNYEKCDVISIVSNRLGNFIDFNIKPKVRLELFSDGYSQVKAVFNKPYPFKRKLKKD